MTTEIIVTLQSEGFCSDFSLPANVALGELYLRLLAALKKISPACFDEWSSILLAGQDGILADESATLFDYGVCSGWYLNVLRKE